MSSYYEAAIRLSTETEMARVVRILAAGPHGLVWREGAYCRARWGTATPWPLLAQLSAALSTEVVAVSEQTNSSVFEYRRYRGAREERGIAFVEDQWIEVRGEPDPWEAGGLFTEEALDSVLEEFEASSDDEVRVRAQFEAKSLLVGQSWPPPPHSASIVVFEALGVPLSHERRDAAPIGRRAPTPWMLLAGAGAVLCFVSGMRNVRLDGMGALGFAVLFTALLIGFRRTSIITMIGGSLLLALGAAMVSFLVGRAFG